MSHMAVSESIQYLPQEYYTPGFGVSVEDVKDDNLTYPKRMTYRRVLAAIGVAAPLLIACGQAPADPNPFDNIPGQPQPGETQRQGSSTVTIDTTSFSPSASEKVVAAQVAAEYAKTLNPLITIPSGSTVEVIQPLIPGPDTPEGNGNYPNVLNSYGLLEAPFGTIVFGAGLKAQELSKNCLTVHAEVRPDDDATDNVYHTTPEDEADMNRPYAEVNVEIDQAGKVQKGILVKNDCSYTVVFKADNDNHHGKVTVGFFSGGQSSIWSDTAPLLTDEAKKMGNIAVEGAEVIANETKAAAPGWIAWAKEKIGAIVNNNNPEAKPVITVSSPDGTTIAVTPNQPSTDNDAEPIVLPTSIPPTEMPTATPTKVPTNTPTPTITPTPTPTSTPAGCLDERKGNIVERKFAEGNNAYQRTLGNNCPTAIPLPTATTVAPRPKELSPWPW